MNSLGQCRTLATGAISYQVIHTLQEIETIAAEWDSLLDQSPCNRAFSCSKWFLVSCAVNPSLVPRVVVARCGDVIAGVLPLVLTNGEGTAAFAGELSDYNDIIAREKDDAVLAGILQHAITSLNDCARIVLSRVRSDSNCLRAARALNPEADFDRMFTGTTRHVSLSSTYESYLSTRSRNLRKSLSRAQRHAKDNNLTIRELGRDTLPPERLSEIFLSLNFDRWGTESYYHFPLPQSFVRGLLPHLFSQNRMRVFALLKDEKLIGLDLCMIGKNSLCSWNGGFLSESEHLSPGNLLIAAGIKRAYDLNLAEYDLLRGDEPYKQRWANSIRRMGKIELEVKRVVTASDGRNGDLYRSRS